MKILVIPDVHGRSFWQEPCSRIEDYDKIIFLGDYMDPYGFENISVETALYNFQDILMFADKNSDKVELLLGNHDMPYFSDTYKSFSMYHSRHSHKYCNDIKQRFDEYRELFKISTTYDDILFTHAGVTPGWLFTVFTPEYTLTTLEDLVFSLNNLLNTNKGLQYLYMISEDRGGRDRYASCIWADCNETMWYQSLSAPEKLPEKVQNIINIRQVFGHTLQAFYGEDMQIEYGNAVENGNNKMIDNCHAYELDTESFTIKQI